MALKLTVPRAAQPVTLAEAKLHLRVDSSDEDALISALIVAATDDAEHLMGRAVLTQRWQLTLDAFNAPPPSGQLVAPASTPDEIALQRPPVTSVVSVKYLQASDGVLTTLAPSEYTLAAASDYTARLVPAWGKSWPATRDMPEAVQIVFECGYADAASVPENIKAWIKLRVGSLYANREQWTTGRNITIAPNPFIDCLLDRYRAWVM